MRRTALRPFSLLIVLFDLSGLVSGRALAAEASLQVASQLEAYYDSKLEETVLDERLDVTLSRDRYTLGVTFLSHSPSDPARLDPNDFGRQQQGLRKRWFEANADGWGVRLGDVYATFGRGLALQVFEDQIVDFDNALDGIYGRGTYRSAQIEVIGGTNSIEEAFQVLKGAHFEMGLPAGLRFGLEGVWSDSTGSGLQGRPGGDRLGGGHLGGSLGRTLDFYGEYVLRDYENYRPGAGNFAQGHAGYASFVFYAGRVQLLGEFKDLLRYQLPFVNPPTALRQHTTTLLNRATHVANIQKNDERGGLLEALVTLNERTRLLGSYSRSEARHAHQPAWEMYGEVERWLGRAEVFLRAAETEETIREGADDVFFERITFSASLLFPLSETWSLDITTETQQAQESNRSTQSFRSPARFRNNLGTVSLNRAPNMSWGLTVETTDDARQNQDPWIWGDWNLRIGDRHQLLLGAGKLRGGQLCSGGVCKIVDPFEGGRLEFLTTF